MFNKKSSLEISIQAIVIVVLAMTLLGLGLGFVRGMFKNISGTTNDVTDQVRQKISDDLITSDKKTSFPKTEIEINKGDSTVLSIGIRNKENDILTYDIDFKAISGPTLTGLSTPLTETALDSWFLIARPKLRSGQSGWELKQSEVDIRNVKIVVPKGAISGTYVLTFEVLDIDNHVTYDQKDIFINVVG